MYICIYIFIYIIFIYVCILYIHVWGGCMYVCMLYVEMSTSDNNFHIEDEGNFSMSSKITRTYNDYRRNSYFPG